ncbi:hypothetical protein ABGB16_11355 [Micromonospora sp. B11E3]|uniref:hypothetical protein n=1 Tax=Micromonospora sp. B11E3 TaxID=3153562 RepID=UPI00325EC28E
MAIVARHLAGAVAAWLVVVVEGVVAYLGLLVCAVATNSNLGGPLAGPLLAVLAGLVGLVTVPLLFIPAVVAGDLTGRRRGLLAQCLIACAVAVVLSVGFTAGGGVATDLPRIGLAMAISPIVVLPPVLAYLGVFYGSYWLARKLRVWRALRLPVGGPAYRYRPRT